MKLASFLRSLGLALGLTTAAVAQSADGSYWSEYPKPANVTNVRVLGSQFLAETPTAYHFFSGYHRTWTVHPVTSPQILGFTNKYCLFRDGNTIYGYSIVSGRVAALPTSGNITVSIGSASSSWTAYVLDGSTVNAFSAFFGDFVPLTVAAAPTISINSHVVMCNDGTNISGFSAFYGNWVTTPNRGVLRMDTWRNGSLVQFTSPDEVVAYSVYTNTWTSTNSFPTSATSVFDGRDGYASLSLNGGADRLWYSVLHGEFLFTNMPLGTATQFSPNCAMLQTPTGLVYGYSPAQSTLTQIPVAGPASVTVATGSFGSYGIVDDSATLQAFSGMTATVAQAPFYVSSTLNLGDTAAFATGPGGLGFAYSSLLGQWFQAPLVQHTAITQNFECILRTVPGGYEAFSARTGTFATLPSTGSISMLNVGAIIGIVGSSGIDVFDPRYGRWEHRATGNAPTFGVHRLTGVGQDGANGYGYSLFTNVWESIPLQGTYLTTTVNSSIGYIATSSHYYVFTGTGSLNTFARFPEFSRFVTLGNPLSHVNTGNPGSFVVGLLSLTGGEQATPFGVLRVDPNPFVLPLGFVPSDGLLFSPIATPNNPSLRGVQIFMQDLLLKPDTSFALTNGLAHYLW